MISIVQALTNLSGSNWLPLATNIGTFDFTDTNAADYPVRFYRVLYASSTGNVIQNLRFPGQYFDAESGLNYNIARDYAPSIGRYIQSDPMGLAGGINQFGYVGQNALLRTDPSGLRTVDVYVWNWRTPSVGHIMITEHNSTDVILSPFPHQPRSSRAPWGPNTSYTFQDTIKEEGRSPDAIIPVEVNDSPFNKVVHEQLSKPAWSALPISDGATHCSKAAYEALKAGGKTELPVGSWLLPGFLGDALQNPVIPNASGVPFIPPYLDEWTWTSDTVF
jgi:RHS repeat-associated protein